MRRCDGIDRRGFQAARFECSARNRVPTGRLVALIDSGNWKSPAILRMFLQMGWIAFDSEGAAADRLICFARPFRVEVVLKSG